MPAKKTRQPGKTGKAVYLLSADRKFRRLSLKKISERVKGARRRTRGRSIATTTTAAETASTAARNPEPAKVASIAIVLAGLFALATLVGASWLSASSVDADVAAAQPEAAVVTADVASALVVPAKPLTAAPAAKAPRTTNASPIPAAVTSTATIRPTETTKPRASRIALVDGPTSAEAYDGRLVSVTGVLVDREMRVSSLKPIAGDCE